MMLIHVLYFISIAKKVGVVCPLIEPGIKTISLVLRSDKREEKTKRGSLKMNLKLMKLSHDALSSQDLQGFSSTYTQGYDFRRGKKLRMALEELIFFLEIHLTISLWICVVTSGKARTPK